MDGKSDKKKELIIRIVCVILSFVLWLYITIAQNPVKEMKLTNVPVEIINSDVLKDSKLVLSPNQEFYVSLSLQGPVSEIYKVSKDQFKISADLGAYALKKGDNKIRVDIKDSPSTISIKNNSYLTIDVKLDDYVERTISVRPDIKVTAKEGFYAQALKLTPNNATISGPGEYVNKVSELLVSDEIKGANDNISMTLPIKAVDDSGKVVNFISINPTNSEVTIPVNKSKVVSINVPSKGKLADSLVLKSITAIPQGIEVIGDEAKLSGIKEISTEQIDLAKIKENQEITVKIVLPEKVKTVNGGETVKVKIEVTKIVTKEFEVPVTLKGVGDGLQAASDTGKIKVSLNGNEDDINSIKPEEITPEVDLTGVSEGEGLHAVKVTPPNDKIKLVSISPEKINVKITKKQ